MGLIGSQGWEAGGLGTGIMGTKFLSELVTTSWMLLVVMDTQRVNLLRSSGLVKGLTFWNVNYTTIKLLQK